MTQTNPTRGDGFLAGLRRDLVPGQLIPDLTAGAVSSVVELPLMLAFASLIFSGELADYAPRGIGFIFMSAFVLAVTIAAGSSVRAVIACPQDSPAAIMALVVVALADTLPGTPRENIFVTTVAAMTITALGTGLVFFLIGWFNQGNLVRFIPYPVIGGFLAGTGLLLLEGGISVMSGIAVSSTQLDAFTDLDLIARWLPGLTFALGLTVLLRRYNHVLLVPGVLLITALVFYGVLVASGTSISDAATQGWLMEKFESGTGDLWQPLTLSEWRAVEWHALGQQAGNIAAIIIVSTISILLNATGLELATERDINLNRELKSAGIGNVLAGLGGGLAGYHLLGASVLTHRMGARRRLPGLMTAGAFLLALLVGGDLLAYIPKLILGGLIVFLGLDFLITWLVDTWGRLPRLDLAIIALIMLVIERIGFLPGIGLGIAVSAGTFVVNYSRTNVVKHTLTGQTYRSAVLRSAPHSLLLDEHGDELFILKLQGFIFFGTAHTLLERVRACFNDPDCASRRCILLDFRAVTGVDSSAALSFVKMRQLAHQQDVTLLFTALSPSIRHRLEPDVLAGEGDTVVKVLIDLDHGVEWAENQIIAAYQHQLSSPTSNQVTDQLESTLMDHHLVTHLLTYLTHDEVEAGTVLVRQGDPPQGLIFIRQGNITIQLERDNAPPVRLRTISQNTFVGEIGMYLDQPATATVIASTPAAISRLTVDALRRMDAAEPDVASAFHRFMAQFLAERVTQTTHTLNTLID